MALLWIVVIYSSMRRQTFDLKCSLLLGILHVALFLSYLHRFSMDLAGLTFGIGIFTSVMQSEGSLSVRDLG